MQRLILRLLVFLVPPAALLAFPAWVLLASGEFTPDETFLELRRQSQPFLVGRAYSDSMGYLKLKTVQVESPEIVALGSSRVILFRQNFFSERFFNAGSGAYQQFEDLLAFLRFIPAGGEPKLIILGLDQKFFNSNWTGHPPDPFGRPHESTSALRLMRASWVDVYRDYFAGKFQVMDLIHPRSDGVRRIGLQAVVRSVGYREDGSLTWPWWDFDAEDLKKIDRHEGEYVRGSRISDRTIEELRTFLKECQKRGIRVAGFLPPFSPRVYRALKQDPNNYGFMFDLADRLRPLFHQYGFSVADFTNPARCEIERDGFFDGLHASENGYRRLWACWMEGDDLLKWYGPAGGGEYGAKVLYENGLVVTTTLDVSPKK
jgi:hypothetical protein